MKSSLRDLRAALVHLDFTVSSVFKPVAALAAAIAVVASALTMYSPTIVAYCYTVIPLSYIAFILVLGTYGLGALVEDLKSGAASLHLAAGLNRLGYATSWLLASVAYPTISYLLSLSLPLILVAPEALATRFSPYSALNFSTATIIGLAVLQLFNNLALLALLAITTKSKGVVSGASFALALLVPFLAGLLIAMGFHWVRNVVAVIAPFFYLFCPSPRGYVEYKVLLAAESSLAVAAAFIAAYLAYAAKRLEVS